jgi:hypothetical protein
MNIEKIAEIPDFPGRDANRLEESPADSPHREHEVDTIAPTANVKPAPRPLQPPGPWPLFGSLGEDREPRLRVGQLPERPPHDCVREKPGEQMDRVCPAMSDGLGEPLT